MVTGMNATMAADDVDRYPTLTAAGRAMLDFMREHPAAPVFRDQSGNRLRPEEVAALRDWEREVADARVGWHPDAVPDWLDDFVATTWREVPHYRRQGPLPARLTDIPPVSRADLAADIAPFVPDTVALDRLINFRTTGTTGHPLLIPSHPLVAGRYLGYHKRALRRFGVEPRHGRGQVGVVLIGHQKRCFTYVSVTPVMDESGLAKINLHPDDWRSPDDRAAWLDAMAPEIVAGDPISFTELLNVPTRIRPRALMSVGMMLSGGLRQALEARFGCPLLDLYSLNEVGPVAVFDPAVGGHVLLQHRLYVELLDPQGRPVAPGERGEITLTGGFNFCLPLLRYRTGDHAALAFDRADAPVLKDFSGRAPVRFRTPEGTWVNNIDVTYAFKPLPFSHYQFRQRADGSLLLRLPARQMDLADTALAALRPLFGAAEIAVEAIDATQDDKLAQYASELEGAVL